MRSTDAMTATMMVKNAQLIVVGEALSLHTAVLQRLRDAGWEICHVADPREARIILLERAGSIVLCRAILPEGNARKLIPAVRSASGSLFLYFPVEVGCWWIPLVLEGTRCAREMAVPSRAFGRLLLEMLTKAPGDNQFSKAASEYGFGTTKVGQLGDRRVTA
jgi:hypothetical protein